jgi:hypothetical protein
MSTAARSTSPRFSSRPEPGLNVAHERELIEDVAAFFDDPLGFVLYAYPWGKTGTPLADETGPDEWQSKFLTDLGALLDQGVTAEEAIRLAVASGHGIGKTAVIAWLVQWFMSTREFPQIVVTASTQTQLSSKTWRELAKWHRLLINRHWFNWTATKYYHVEYPETWFASAIPWSENNADAFAGTHEKYVLIIFDEASAIAKVIWDTTEGALTTPAALWVVFGNYTKNTGSFHKCFAGKTRDRWHRSQIDSRTAKKANQAQIRQWIEDYGEDSDFVRIRVRGIAPRSGSDQFIGQDLVDASSRYKAQGYESLPKILALDVARYGDNQSVSGLRQGRRFTILAKWRELPIDQLADKFIEHIEAEQPDAIVVDGDGIGGAVVDLIKRKNFHLRNGKEILFEFHGNATPSDGKMYYNRRAEVWGLTRQAMKDGLELPVDPELQADLVAPEYFFAKKGDFDVIQLESKDDMRGRGVASPDSADTLAMTYSVKLAPVRRQPPPTTRPVYTIGQSNQDWMGR